MKIKLMEDTISKEEVKAAMDCFKSGKYTQGELVNKFEKNFAAWNGSKYAVMVNSGSSANLLITFMLKEKYGLKDGDEVLVPSVTWPTTIYPVIQNNLVPVFCDVDESFNMDIHSMKRVIGNKTKAVFLVHLLGQPANLKEIEEICNERGLLLLEDCCESTGAKFNGVKVGNFGLMGSFSFYYGHHMTTIEGGMIVTDDFELYDLLKSARSHGWIRDSARMDKYPLFKDKRFVFDMLGYNLRSTNVNAAIGIAQLNKLDASIKIRLDNHRHFLEKVSSTDLGYQKVNLKETSSFSFGLLFKNKAERDYILENLQSKGVESRPIVAGNLLRQPVFKNMRVKADKTNMADLIHDCGMYIPNNQFISTKKIDYMINSVNELLGNFKEK